MTAEVQRDNVKVAARELAPLAEAHRSAHEKVEAYPLDVLGAQTEGMIGYMIEQEMGNLLPFEKPLATILTMVEVDRADPAFSNPTKFVGPVYDKAQADAIAADKGWAFKPDGQYWRRVVPSPEPKRIFELRPIRWLLDHEAVVICAGGGGVPTMYEPGNDRVLEGVEAVIDKDLASELLARELAADLLVMATDVDGVYIDWGKPTQWPLDTVTAKELRRYPFAAGSMGPKVEAALRFVTSTGGRAAIGALPDLAKIVEGTAGTNVVAGR